MVEKETILKEKLKFKGITNFKNLYNFMHDWLKEEEFDVTEESYSEKVKGATKEIEILWSIARKLTDYYEVKGNVKIKITNLKEVEVEISGKRKTMEELEFELEIKGVLVRDWDNQWASPTTKFFKELYDKYVVKSRTLEMKERVGSIVQEFKEQVKAYLELTGKR